MALDSERRIRPLVKRKDHLKQKDKKFLNISCFFNFQNDFNPLSARIFTVFGHSLLEDRVLHKEAWVAKLLGTHLSI